MEKLVEVIFWLVNWQNPLTNQNKPCDLSRFQSLRGQYHHGGWRKYNLYNGMHVLQQIFRV